MSFSTTPNARTAVERIGQVRTKIVATLGPACGDEASLRALVEAGVDCFRLNLSHGDHAAHAEVLGRVRAVEHSMARPIGVLADLGGPKIRLGKLPDGQIECPIGTEFTLRREPDPADPMALCCTYQALPDDLRPGDSVIFADGVVAMEAVDNGPGWARLAVTLPGRLRSGAGVNLPGTDLAVECLTAKDIRDLDFLAALETPADYVAMSFVQRPSDVQRLRAELDARGLSARIVAKIEKPRAVEQFDAILRQSDAIMVARGDLGVEMDVARVPGVQKRIIAACHKARVPVITATQMLTSMEHSSQPTRAEATDVFNAVLDGTDAVMLSGETAVGSYPVEAVSTMSRILSEAEKLLPTLRDRLDPGSISRGEWITQTTELIVEAACLIGRKLSASLLVVSTRSGRTALEMSKHRDSAPILAITDTPAMARAMSLYWGVTPLCFESAVDSDLDLSKALSWAREHGLARSRSRVVLVRGTTSENAVHNAIFVQELD